MRLIWSFLLTSTSFTCAFYTQPLQCSKCQALRTAPHATKETTTDSGDTKAAERAKLAELFGAGRGKHAGKDRRKHSNKYAAASKQTALDPWDQQLQKADSSSDAAVAAAEEAERRDAKRERGATLFPDEVDIDPYDPTTFGFMEVGVVLGAHGIKGELKVRCLSDFAEDRLCRAGARHIKAPDRRYPRQIRLLEGRQQRDDVYLVTLEGITDRDKAGRYRDHVIYVAENERPDLAEDEYMITDLVGLKVYLDPARKEYVGEIVGVVVMDDLGTVAAKGQDLLELELPPLAQGSPSRTCYIPMVKEIVPVVDIAAGYVLIEPPEGLLDNAVEKTERVVVRGLLAPGEDRSEEESFDEQSGSANSSSPGRSSRGRSRKRSQ